MGFDMADVVRADQKLVLEACMLFDAVVRPEWHRGGDEEDPDRVEDVHR